MAKVSDKEIELTNLVMSLDRQLRERKESYQSLLEKCDKYLDYSLRLEKLLAMYDPDWFEKFKDK